MSTQICPCGTEKKYSGCCGKFIDKDGVPATPEELMRSRYTAFTLGNADYIGKTMTSPAVDDFDAEETKKFAESVDWVKLEVIASSVKGNRGSVEFLAHYKQKLDKHVIHEIGDFMLKDGKWFYVDGITPRAKANLVGRNDPCTCNSGKKYKKCCGK